MAKTYPKTYGAFVNWLPINQHKKGWLKQNWLGGAIGGAVYLAIIFLPYFIKSIEIGPGSLHNKIARFPLAMNWTSSSVCMIPDFSILIYLFGNFIIYIIGGIFIYSFRRR